ncbi:MAG TPA: hypothetical protein EYO31_02945 [Phycisphaerales bacterium]|nr:hypothetical protein [Phycisphaerales bacterium]
MLFETVTFSSVTTPDSANKPPPLPEVWLSLIRQSIKIGEAFLIRTPAPWNADPFRTVKPDKIEFIVSPDVNETTAPENEEPSNTVSSGSPVLPDTVISLPKKSIDSW